MYLPDRLRDSPFPDLNIALAEPGRVASIDGDWALVEYPQWGQFGCPVTELRRAGPVLLARRCPGCDQLPGVIVGDRQAFCNTVGCQVLCWSMTDDPATFKATATRVDLSDERGEATA